MSNTDNMDGDHIITVCPEQLQTTPTGESSSSSNHIVIPVEEISASMEDAINAMPPEEAALSGEKGECRFCQEADLVCQLEAPCACTGTLKYAHRRCTFCWCNTKGDIICEICRQPYGPDYAVSELSSNHTRYGFTTPGTNTQIQSPLLLPDQRVAALNHWNMRVPSRGVLYATVLVLFLTVLILKDVFSFSSSPKKEQNKTSDPAFCIIMIVLAPFSLLSCLYECQALIRRNTEDRNNEERDRAA